MDDGRISTVQMTVILSAVISLMAVAAGTIILVDESSMAAEHIGLLLVIIGGTVIPSLLGMLHAGKARDNTNGKLDARIQDAVYRAQNVRRREVEGEGDPE